jgi:hypothetical protein
MSASLVMNNNAPHTFVDDLESVLYVIIWLVLMYSPNSMTVEQRTAFMQGVLDPKQYSGTGGTTKADFLKGRTVLQNIIFQDRPLLPGLLLELATLFAVRYEISPTVPVMISAFQIHYQQRREQLESHEYIIKLISDTIQDPNTWPTNDAAVEQSLFKTKEEMKKRTKTLYDLETSERPIKKLRLDPTDSE